MTDESSYPEWYRLKAELKVVSPGNATDGPIYSYRGATITCHKGGHVCCFTLDGHPLSGRGSHGDPRSITHKIDAWLDHQRLPAGYKVADG